MRALTDLIADQLKLPTADRDRLRWSALLHDIGKLTVPVAVLNKAGKPDDAEWQLLLGHPLEGQRLAAPLAEWLGPWAATIPQHHEKYDGSGYPLGLTGEEISLGGRIVAVADSFDAITSVRSYKKGASPEAARRELAACAGTHFDPLVVRAFLEASVGRQGLLGAPLAWLGELSTGNGLPELGQLVSRLGSSVFSGLAAVVGIGAIIGIGVHHAPVHRVEIVASTAPSPRAPSPTARATAHHVSASSKATSPDPARSGKSSGQPPSARTPVSNPLDPPSGSPGGPTPTVVDPTNPPSPPANSGIPTTVPGPPTIGTATAGDASATVTWTAPTSDGGSPITSYTVTAADSTTPANGGQTCTWTTGSLTCTVNGLTNGDSYIFTVTATNAVGTGAASGASSPVTPVTSPGAPTIGTATAGDASATVTWTAPTSDGGSPITNYYITTYIGGTLVATVGVGRVTDTVMTGLANGHGYTFTVTAMNAVSPGPSSAHSNSVVPTGVPDVPTIGTATAGDASATVTWTAPTSDGGSPITSYTVTAADSTTPANGGQTCTWSSGPLTCTVNGLTNGDSYIFTVTATNAVGTGAASGASSPVTPTTVPGLPTIGVATAGDASAMVTWTAPASDGGSPITSYTVTAADSTTPANGGQTCTWTTGSLTCTVNGLTNGDSYIFTVTATNAVGTGAASGASSPVTPVTSPGAPTIGTATAGDASATVTWTAPTSDGGSPITNYYITTYIGGTLVATVGVGRVTDTVMTGLANGHGYTFTVTAMNAVSPGPSSAHSNSVVPTGVPDVPTIGTATAGDASATVTWTAPTSDGGSPITSYTVTAADSTTPANGGQTCTWSSGPLTCTVNGLTNGDSYIFTVTATNAVGTGAASGASSPVTPTTVPGLPTIGAATAGDASAMVTWTAPASDGGTPITNYVITPYVGATAETSVIVGNVTSDIVSGLINGTAYSFTVSALNASGEGLPSDNSNLVTPATSPGAPTIVTATPANASATVSWTAPSSDGGSPVTGYTVVATDTTTPANGGQTCTWTTGSLTCTVSGLTNGDTYTFVAQASNVVGASVPSAAFGPVIPPSGDWTESAPALAPSPRATSSEAWDPATGQLILFGGGACSGSGGGCTVTNDTWSWTGTTWTSLAPSSSPPPLAEASLAYDPAAGQLVLFGGIGSSGSSLSGTWIWNGSNWLQESPSSSPPARHGASLGYDPNTDQLILYGGSAAAGITPMASDTWAWNGTNWEQLTPSTSPPPLYAATMAWDSSTGQLILFGGTTNGTYNGTNETWAWTGSNWSELFPASSPPARLRATMAMDPSSGQLLLFGGYGIGQVDLGDMWAWNGSSWMQLTPPTLPTSRADASMAFDSATGTIVLFGGSILEGEQLLGDTWLYP